MHVIFRPFEVHCCSLAGEAGGRPDDEDKVKTARRPSAPPTVVHGSLLQSLSAALLYTSQQLPRRFRIGQATNGALVSRRPQATNAEAWSHEVDRKLLQCAPTYLNSLRPVQTEEDYSDRNRVSLQSNPRIDGNK
jgi:hypothetical protein